MNENLVGYLLDVLDPDERRDVEGYLERDPDARRHLELLKQSLEPLEADCDDVEVPPGLWIRTLGRVAEYRCRPVQTAPLPLSARPSTSRNRWRRADILVAASILLCVMLLIPSAAVHLRAYQDRNTCQNNLRVLYTALSDHRDRNGGNFPMVQEGQKASTVLRPILAEAGGVRCPANNISARDDGTGLLDSPYSYPLGYRDRYGRLHGLDREVGGLVPLMADRPFVGGPGPADERDNSPNHHGQNVLFTGGHSRFYKDRHVGPDGDDIFLNNDRRARASRDFNDAVLGTDGDQP